MAKRKREPKMAPLGGGDDDPKDRSDEEQVWGKRLVNSKKFQAQYSAGWDENRRLIFSEMASNKDTAGSGTPPWAPGGPNAVAYGWGLYEGLETSIYVQNPEVVAAARDGGSMPIARRVTQIVNYDFDQMNTKDAGNLCLLDTFITGYGAVIEGVENYHTKDSEGKRTGILAGQEFEIRRIAPLDILFDRGSRRLDLSDCKYLFTAWYPTIEQLKNDESITDLPDDEELESWPECNEFTRANAPMDQNVPNRLSPGQGSGEKDPAFKTVCVWEVYDKVNHEVLYLSDKDHRIIGREKWPVSLRFGCRDLFPQTLLYSHPVPGRFYPRPEAELIAPQLRELNITERLISEDSRTKFRKWITLAGIFSEDQKSKVTDTSLPNSVLFVDGTKLGDLVGAPGNISIEQLDIKKLIVPIEDISPKQDLYTRYQMLEGEIQHIVGYGPAARGGLPSTRSAREAMMINQRQDARLDKRKNRIEDFYRLMAQKHIRFLQKYASAERYAKVLPKSGQLETWFSYGRTDIQGDFEFDVVTGSSVPKTTEVKKASELQLFQAITPVLMQLGLDVRPAFYRLAEFNDWDNIDDLFSGMVQQAQQGAAALAGFNQGKVPPEAILNSMSQLVAAVLGPKGLELVKQQLAGQQGQQPTPGQANTPRGDSAPLRTTQGVE